MIKKIIVLILVLTCAQNFAQKNNSSPYSSLGIGDAVPPRTVEEMSMGGVGVSSINNFNLHFNNPASYASLILTTYSLAGENRAYSFEDDKNKQTSSNAYLSYLAVGIPIGVKGGFAFGLQPKTSVGYSIENSILDSDGEPIEVSLYEGDGGINRVFLGGGYEVFKDLTLGFEAEYLFGVVKNSILNQKRDVQLATRYKANSEVEGLAFEFGAIYEKELKKNLYLNFGAKVGFESSLDSRGSEYLYSVIISVIEIPRDTILNERTSGKFVTPLETSLGFSVGKKNKWSAGIDYSFRDAINITGNLENFNPKLRYQNANNVSVGGYYIPRYNSISAYWERIIFRWGFNASQTGLMVDGIGNGLEFTPIDELGMSFGVGLPVGGYLSRLNLGFEYGQRGTTDNGLVEEKFFNFRVGLTLGSKWFKKREIN